MQNKIDIISGAIHQCDILQYGGVVHLSGLHSIDITRGKMTDFDLINVRNSLVKERENLQIRVDRITR